MEIELPFQLGPYDLVEELGVGGFATVYRGVLRGSMGFARDFAIKLLAPEAVEASPEMLALLADEARVLSRIRHRSVVSPQWFGSIEHEERGTIFMLVMEHVEGTTLHSLLALDEHEHGLQADGVSLQIVLRVAEALDAAHSLLDQDGEPLGLVHRDVKPANIMVTPAGNVVLLDFGIAKARDRIADATRSDRIRGTIGYLSPEQISGGELDFRADHFALGAVLYELITGEKLLGNATVLQQLQRIATFDPTEHLARLRFELPAVEHIAAKLLARRPEERYEATCLLVDDLREVLRGMGADEGAMIEWAKRNVPPALALHKDIRALRAAGTLPLTGEEAAPRSKEPKPQPPPTVQGPGSSKGLPTVVIFAAGAALGAAVGAALG